MSTYLLTIERRLFVAKPSISCSMDVVCLRYDRICGYYNNKCLLAIAMLNLCYLICYDLTCVFCWCLC